jgi:hypothetical protein
MVLQSHYQMEEAEKMRGHCSGIVPGFGVHPDRSEYFAAPPSPLALRLDAFNGSTFLRVSRTGNRISSIQQSYFKERGSGCWPKWNLNREFNFSGYGQRPSALLSTVGSPRRFF